MEPQAEQAGRNGSPVSGAQKLVSICLTLYFMFVLGVLFIILSYQPIQVCVNKSAIPIANKVVNLTNSSIPLQTLNNCNLENEVRPHVCECDSQNTANDDPDWLHVQLRNYSIGGYHTCNSIIIDAYCVFLYGEAACNWNRILNLTGYNRVIVTTSMPLDQTDTTVQPPSALPIKSNQNCTIITNGMCKDDVYRLNPANNCFAGNATCWFVKPQEEEKVMIAPARVDVNRMPCFNNGVFDPKCWINLPANNVALHAVQV
jgi:hypothetical protein